VINFILGEIFHINEYIVHTFPWNVKAVMLP
jgi:hypothetical protein